MWETYHNEDTSGIVACHDRKTAMRRGGSKDTRTGRWCLGHHSSTNGREVASQYLFVSASMQMDNPSPSTWIQKDDFQEPQYYPSLSAPRLERKFNVRYAAQFLASLSLTTRTVANDGYHHGTSFSLLGVGWSLGLVCIRDCP